MSRNGADWWHGPRKVSVIVDNESWILPYAEQLVAKINATDDIAKLCRTHEEITQGDIAFYLGCVKITPPEVLKKNNYNLVVHESDLPKGKGFAPLTWQILEGASTVPVCLIEAENEVDSGNIYLRKELYFDGYELCDDIRRAQGEISVDICLEFLSSNSSPEGKPQQGESTFYQRRSPKDSELDINKSIAEQFNLLRTVDNKDYPAFFYINDIKYYLKIEKAK